MKMNNERIFRIPFATVYDLLVQKALRKNRTRRKSIKLFPGLRVTAFRKSGKNAFNRSIIAHSGKMLR